MSVCHRCQRDPDEYDRALRDLSERVTQGDAEIERLRVLLKRWLKWLDVQSQEPVERVADDTRAALAGEVERKGDEENEDRASH